MKLGFLLTIDSYYLSVYCVVVIYFPLTVLGIRHAPCSSKRIPGNIGLLPQFEVTQQNFYSINSQYIFQRISFGDLLFIIYLVICECGMPLCMCLDAENGFALQMSHARFCSFSIQVMLLGFVLLGRSLEEKARIAASSDMNELIVR